MFRGTFTALVTPFRESAIDFTALRNLIESQIAAGIDGIIAVGTTGESPTLTHDERKEVIRCAIETANKRCLVLAGTGSYSTRKQLRPPKRQKNSALMVHSWLPLLQQTKSGRLVSSLFRDCEINSASSDALQYSGTMRC